MSRLNMDCPAVYAIRVQGILDHQWSDILAGIQILVARGEPETYTQLVGELPDQAALLGVVNSLFNFGFPILDVRLMHGH